MSDDILFQVVTPLGCAVKVTKRYWEIISTVKHPAMAGRERDVERTLAGPSEIRRSRSDPEVYLFHRQERADRWLCAVAKRLNSVGFLIAAYPTDAIKEGVRVWPR